MAGASWNMTAEPDTAFVDPDEGGADAQDLGSLPAWGDAAVDAEGVLSESDGDGEEKAAAAAPVVVKTAAPRKRQTRLSLVKALVAGKKDLSMGMLTMDRKEGACKPDNVFGRLVPDKEYIVESSTVGPMKIMLKLVQKKGKSKRFRHFQLTLGGDVRFTRFNDAVADYLVRNSKTVSEAEELLEKLLQDGPTAVVGGSTVLGIQAGEDSSVESEGEVSDDEIAHELEVRAKIHKRARKEEEQNPEAAEPAKQETTVNIPMETFVQMVRITDRMTAAFFNKQ